MKDDGMGGGAVKTVEEAKGRVEGEGRKGMKGDLAK